MAQVFLDTRGLSVRLAVAHLLESGRAGWGRKYIFVRFLTAIVLGPGISGVLAAVVFQHMQNQRFLPALNSWATADALGIAALLPISLAVGSAELKSLFTLRQLPKTTGVFLVMSAVTVLVFYVTRFPLLFLLYPTLLIVEAVLAFAGSAIALPLVCTVAVYLTMHGHGPLWSVDHRPAHPAQRSIAGVSRLQSAGSLSCVDSSHGAQKDVSQADGDE